MSEARAPLTGTYVANQCPFCHDLIVELPPHVEIGDTVEFAMRRSLAIQEQRIRDHVRIEHPGVWPLVSRLADEMAAGATR